MLDTVHMGLALVLKTPELALSDEECEKLSSKIARLTELYDVKVVDEKTMAWFGLVTAAGTIYGPRVITLLGKKKVSRQVVPIRSHAPDISGNVNVM